MKAPGNRKEIRGHVFTAGKQAFDVYASSAIFCRAQATMQGEYCRLYISWSCLCDHCASIGQGEYNPYQHNTNMQTPCAPMRPPQQNGSGLTHIVSGQQRLKQQVGCAPEQQSRTAGTLNCKRSNVQGRAEAKASSDCSPLHQLMPSVCLSPRCCVTLASDTSAEAFMLVVQMSVKHTSLLGVSLWFIVPRKPLQGKHFLVSSRPVSG